MGNLTTESVLIALSGLVIVFSILAALSGMIVLISRVVGAITGQAASAAATPASPVAPQAAPAPVVLAGVDDLTAACIMAIVSDETGIALDELTFRSIKAL